MPSQPDEQSFSSSDGSLAGSFFFVTGRSCLPLTKITVEPILFVLFLAGALTDSLATNILLERTCTVVFNRTEKICKNHAYSDIEADIQTYTAKVIMVKMIMEAVVSGVVSMFIGPWTDKNGRKLFLILPIVGYFFHYLMWFVFALIPSIPPYYFVLASLPPALFGGLSIVFSGVFSYISDITTDRNRAYRMTIANLSVGVGILAGYLFTAALARLYLGLYLIAIYVWTLFITSLLIIYLCQKLPETINVFEASEEEGKFFTCHHIKEMVKCLIARRPAFGRSILIILILLNFLDIVILTGDASFRFLVSKKVLGWTMDDYNIFSATLSSTSIVISTFGLWIFCKVLKLPEMWIAILVSTVSVISSVCLAMSNTSLDFYLAANLGVLCNLFMPVLKAEMSKIFPSHDAGKIFAFLSTLEAGAPFLSSVLFTAVYNKVIVYRAQYIYLVPAVLYLLTTISSVSIVLLNWVHGSPYMVLNEEDVEDQGANSAIEGETVTCS